MDLESGLSHLLHRVLTAVGFSSDMDNIIHTMV